jgi:hypothetical protein
MGNVWRVIGAGIIIIIIFYNSIMQLKNILKNEEYYYENTAVAIMKAYKETGLLKIPNYIIIEDFIYSNTNMKDDMNYVTYLYSNINMFLPRRKEVLDKVKLVETKFKRMEQLDQYAFLDKKQYRLERDILTSSLFRLIAPIICYLEKNNIIAPILIKNKNRLNLFTNCANCKYITVDVIE